MIRTTKFWTCLGVAAVSGALAAHAAVNEGVAKQHQGQAKHLYLADASGEGGEGGEAGAAGGGDQHIGYLTDLGLVEGHMRVGVELYGLGDTEAAKTHMKHPGDEIYGNLKQQFEALKVKGFADELATTAAVVEKGGTVEEARAKLQDLRLAIAEARDGETTMADTAAVVARLARQAADEYAVGVKDGKVADSHEYQDAWGFVQTAIQLLKEIPAEEREEHGKDIGEIEAAFASMQAAWPDLTGKSPVITESSLIAGAVARIELAAGAIK